MYRLLQLLHTYRAFLLLLFFEIICIWLLVGNNPYHSAAYFRTSNILIGSLYETKSNMEQYFSLPRINQELANDNARLREILSSSQVPIIVQSNEDSARLSKGVTDYQYLSARVINNSTRFTHNYLTIDKGAGNGIEPGMGVVSANGIVGKVMSVSEKFATVASLLNTDVYVSAYLKRNETFGSVHWDADDIGTTRLMYIPRHIELQQGDSVVTSGYNSIFPEDILLGFVSDFSLEDNASWYDIEVDLSNDFSKLSFVYVIKNPDREERSTLEAAFEAGNE